jgi:hypothetical protein
VDHADLAVCDSGADSYHHLLGIIVLRAKPRLTSDYRCTDLAVRCNGRKVDKALKGLRQGSGTASMGGSDYEICPLRGWPGRRRAIYREVGLGVAVE